jgi:hypothetical protein
MIRKLEQVRWFAGVNQAAAVHFSLKADREG